MFEKKPQPRSTAHRCIKCGRLLRDFEAVLSPDKACMKCKLAATVKKTEGQLIS